jgi:hypothetical protein
MPFWPEIREALLAPRLVRPLALGVGTRLATLLVAAWGLVLLGEQQPSPFLLHGERPHPNPAVALFQRWDSYWFLNVAHRGYHYHGVQEQLWGVEPSRGETNITPFPLYPLLMAAGERLVGDAAVAGLLTACLCYLAAMVLLYRRVATLEGEPLALRTVLFLSVYPTAFIFNAIYSAPRLLLPALLCLESVEDGRPRRAGLYGLLASLTRLAGGLLAPCILLEQLWLAPAGGRRRALLQGLLGALLASLGWAAYFCYLRRLTGSFWIYFTAQQGWHKQLVAPWTGLAGIAVGLLSGNAPAMADFMAALLFMGLALWGLRRLRGGQALYLLLGLLMPLCSSNPLGLPRYLMVLYPGFLLLARLSRGPLATAGLASAFALLQGPLLLAWLRWQHSL